MFILNFFKKNYDLAFFKINFLLIKMLMGYLKMSNNYF